MPTISICIVCAQRAAVLVGGKTCSTGFFPGFGSPWGARDDVQHKLVVYYGGGVNVYFVIGHKCFFK